MKIGARSLRLGIACAVAAFTFIGVSCKKATNEIRIGVFTSLTGSTATWGQMGKRGVDLAVEEINAEGGLLGKKVAAVYEDDQSLPEQAKTAALKLIKQFKVVALIGENASSRSLAAAPEAQSSKIPMVSPFSTNPKVTQVGDYIFRVCYIDPFQGAAMAKFAYTTLGAHKVAILRDVKNDYSVGLADFFIKTFKELGGEIVSDVSYSEGDIEFRPQLTSIKSAQPQALFIPGYYTEIGLIARQARELGITTPMLGGDGWDSPKTTEIGGDSVNNSYFSAMFAADDPDQSGATFKKKFFDRYQMNPDGTASVNYEAAKVVFDAIKRAGTTDGAKLRDALAATKDFPGVSGKFSIDSERNAKKRIVIMQISDKKVSYNSSVEPN